MPRFFKDMPQPASGVWDAAVIRTTSSTRREVWYGQFNGRRRAYIAVRIMALWHDLWTDSCGGEIGIEWRISRNK